ncbi:MAG TPA: hypothetical protein VIU62_00240 [Chloroflexota bacterium]|jgi:hypothetical protein
MIPIRRLLAALAAGVVLSFGSVAVLPHASVAMAAPVEQSTGGVSIPNPFEGLASMLSPENLGKLIQDTAVFLLKQMVSGLHGLLVTLTQGDNNVITHTPPRMTYLEALVIQKHDALLVVMDWGFAAALGVMGILVILGPSSPLSFPAAGEILPRVIIAYIAAHSSLQWGGWFIDLNNALCTAVAPADPFPLTSTADVGTALALLGLALLYGFMAVFLGLFMFARVQLIAVLLILAPLAAVLWVLPGRPRQWGELWMDLFFSNLFVQFIQVLALSFGVELLKTAGGDTAGFVQFLSGAATLLLVFRVPSLVNAAVGGGATSFLGLVALFRGLQQMGIHKLSQDAQRSMGQAAAQAPGAAWNFVQHPRATVTSAATREWQDMANSPAGQVVRAAGRAAGSVAGRLRDEAVVRRGV